MPDREQLQNRILFSLSNEIARIRGKDDMLHLIRTTLKQYVDFDDSFIMRYNQTSKTCRSYIFHVENGRSANPAFDSQLDIEYPVEDDRITDNDMPEVQDVELLLSAGHKQLSFIQSTGIKEFVTFKLVEGNSLIGLFVLLSEKKNSLTKDSLDLLRKISYPISIATANIIANEEITKREEEKNLLLSLSHEIAALKNRQDLFHVVNGKIKKLFSVQEFGFSKIDEGGETFSALVMDMGEEIRSHSDYDKTIATHFSVADPLFTEVINAEDPVLYEVDELAKQPDLPAYVYFWKSLGIQKVLIAALRVGGAPVGTAIFILKKDAVINTKNLLLKGVCSQLAVAVSNILANEKIQKRDEEKTILLSLSNEFAALKNREDLSKVVNARIKVLFSLEEFGIAQIDESGETYSAFTLEFNERSKQIQDFASVISARYSVHDPICSQILQSEEPLLFDVEEIFNQPDMPAYVGFWKKSGFRFYLTMRLRVGGKNIGYIVFHLPYKEAVDPKSILLRGICAQLAVAVSNILANEKILAREDEKARLLEFSNAMASARDKQTLAKILKTQLKDLFGIEDYVIHALSKDKKTHRPVLFDQEADFAQHPDFQKLIYIDTDVNDGVFNKILASDDMVAFNVEEWFNSPTPPAYSDAAKAIDLKRMAGIPIKLGRENIAVMNFRKDGISPFTFQRPLFKSICSQLAISISNIMANDEINGREAEKSLLLEFSNAIASVRDKYVFAKVLKQQLMKLFLIEDYVINILSEDGQEVIRFMYDIENEIFQKQEFLKLLDNPINVNDGVFNKILESDVPVTFKVEEWATWKNPPVYLQAAIATGLRNLTGMRLQLGEKNIAFISFKHDDFGLPPSQLPFLKSICSQITIAVSNIIANEKVNEQLVEIRQYKEQLEEEKIYLKEEIETAHNYSEIIGESPGIKKVFRMVTQVAASDSTVLLLGETGTGKELIARAIHNSSPRKDKLMIKINCAALPANLIESELFGHERGSFTGAFERRIGKFELANNGTLFLDEIGEMPLELQVKLLRALQEKEIERIGGKTTIKTDVRIIAATNRDLEKLMEEGKFRLDLYYRLNIFPIQLPPLRERREDIPQLASHFVLRFCKKAGKNITSLSNKALEQLQQYDWPGNIRELEHLIERSVLLATGDSIKALDLPNPKTRMVTKVESESFKIQTIFDNEKEYILKILKYTDGRITGEGGAAQLLGIPPSTLNSRIKKLGIRKEHHG
ncbi:sigma-54-dependent Fis family transcriptional regulator [Lacibacter sediminis]|uniref:Sigma 54-interacting transcriptional regulator n=1 Tax=Lacibacter sediminis TaxID=2760713 RepID=A0A7G5XKA7_9BACT|nr:sigma 54-interacting transcriptional regulator [Lacibacter sediminis]QNA45910.1 sigma 54-interacting transcriptional regulator [Lacibacter sediminis]